LSKYRTTFWHYSGFGTKLSPFFGFAKYSKYKTKCPLSQMPKSVVVAVTSRRLYSISLDLNIFRHNFINAVNNNPQSKKAKKIKGKNSHSIFLFPLNRFITIKTPVKNIANTVILSTVSAKLFSFILSIHFPIII